LPGIPARKEDIMERTYESAAALVSRAAGPLAGHLGAFVGSLIDRQFTASVIYVKAQHALAFDGWLAKRGVVLADLGDVHIERYQHRLRRRHQHILAETRRRERNHITQLLQFLRDHGACPAARIEITAADDLAARYERNSGSAGAGGHNDRATKRSLMVFHEPCCGAVDRVHWALAT
jgi:hypothetical protein